MIEYQREFVDKCCSGLCRSCQKQGLMPVLDLGPMPLSDGLVSKTQLDHVDRKYPLELAYCPNCSLVQILETVPPEMLFCDDYPYYSSFSDALLSHSRENAMNLIDRRGLNGESLVIELASNDGYLLKNFVEKGIPVLGIDPAQGPAKEAEAIGVPTMCTFFTRDLARKLRSQGNRADVIIANNVLAHVADTNGFVQGIKLLLKDDGVAVIEVPYVRDLVDHCEFDTIYHEHLCYFSVTALDRLFRRHDLYLNDIEKLSIHGGSLRLYLEHRESPKSSVRSMLEEEAREQIDQYPYYENFHQSVQTIRSQMRQMLSGLKASGKTIAAYGAAAKGTIMLNYIGADSELINFVVDRNIHKQGKYLPGVRIPIFEPERLMRDKPDYVVILPWNFKDEILSQQTSYRMTGGKFIIPIPSPAIV
ncbi:MAG: class I SAM-dependent methyltransferase [Phycisphaerae bacterium]|nr:class I SAM-dependent methyltransferase [Phycisphaerae bacterium]